MELPERFKKEDLIRFLKFSVTGGMNTLIDVGIYYLLAVIVGLNVYFAHTCSYVCGMLNSYLINRRWTFNTKSRFFSLEMAKFVIVNVAVWALGLLLINILMTQFGFGELPAKIGATGVTMIVNFVLNRLWVFQ